MILLRDKLDFSHHENWGENSNMVWQSEVFVVLGLNHCLFWTRIVTQCFDHFLYTNFGFHFSNVVVLRFIVGLLRSIIQASCNTVVITFVSSLPRPFKSCVGLLFCKICQMELNCLLYHYLGFFFSFQWRPRAYNSL